MKGRSRTLKAVVRRLFSAEILSVSVAVFSALVILWNLSSVNSNNVVLLCAGVAFALAIAVALRIVMDPDSVRARQSDAMLKLASEMLACMSEGLDAPAAQKICGLLLPSTAAIAVAITDKERILGYVGYGESENTSGNLIRTHATHATIADGETRILFTPEDIGFPQENTSVKAAIIVPLTRGRSVEGALKFYYRSAIKISETQKSIAQGLGQLLSTQMAASALEEQANLATSMELKMLQSQINPHFLFNTINTIASLIRTDPETARKLLREFAVFYRRTLEDSADLIMFSREMEQTQRYFAFEVARFGADRVVMKTDIDSHIDDMMVPPFLIQPLVENAVRHAMPSEGMLTISVTGEVQGEDVIVCVIDDGVGMTEEARRNIMHPESSTGLGIAVKNVHDRVRGYFGPGTCMEVESQLGQGTCVRLVLKEGARREYQPDASLTNLN